MQENKPLNKSGKAHNVQKDHFLKNHNSIVSVELIQKSDNNIVKITTLGGQSVLIPCNLFHVGFFSHVAHDGISQTAEAKTKSFKLALN